MKTSNSLPGPLQRLSEPEQPPGVSGRTALLVVLATLIALFVLYELINLQSSTLDSGVGGRSPGVWRGG